jgi:TatA/E family protein of Tat protein translocase
METEALAIGQIGAWQLLLVFAILLLLFGARRLPGLARSMGASLMQLKRGLRELDPRAPQQPAWRARGRKENGTNAEGAARPGR